VLALGSLFQYDAPELSAMPLYEYECAKGHRFEAVQKVKQKPLTKCSVCSAKAHRVISQPTLLHNRGIYVFDRETKDDVLRSRPSSLKSLKKDRF
jgi:putative FmdB family regulatory protein